MITMSRISVLLLSFIHLCSCQSPPRRGQVLQPLLLDSFLPAGMQAIAHYTDLMKYDVRPSPDGESSTTTFRPTPPHNPAIFAPHDPPGYAAYHAKNSNYEEYIERLKNNQPGFGYFDRYHFPLEGISRPNSEDIPNISTKYVYNNNEQLINPDRRVSKVLQQGHNENLPENLNLVSMSVRDLINQINRIDIEDVADDNEEKSVIRFSENFDDDPYLRSFIIGNKRPPPVQAYVTLLFLYDLLNKEAKKVKLNQYGGYTESILRILSDTSRSTAADQLETILSKIVEHQDTTDQKTLEKINTVLNDLQISNSYINDALRYIPPLQFAL